MDLDGLHREHQPSHGRHQPRVPLLRRQGRPLQGHPQDSARRLVEGRGARHPQRPPNVGIPERAALLHRLPLRPLPDRFCQRTEETETIDGLTDHWLKVEYEPGKFGWIFGGYASVERGGPKYYIPEKTVIFDLSWY